MAVSYATESLVQIRALKGKHVQKRRCEIQVLFVFSRCPRIKGIAIYNEFVRFPISVFLAKVAVFSASNVGSVYGDINSGETEFLFRFGGSRAAAGAGVHQRPKQKGIAVKSGGFTYDDRGVAIQPCRGHGATQRREGTSEFMRVYRVGL